MREKGGGKFLFKGNLLSRLQKSVELSHEWFLENFKYQEPEFYYILFDESEILFFEVPPGRKNTYIKNMYLMLLSCIFYIKK